MPEYEIFKFDDDINEIVVFINSVEDLYYLQDDIFSDISKIKGENFNVLIDLFLRNGFSFNRFTSLDYKGRDKCKSFIVNPRDVSEEIKLKIRNYLVTHMEVLNNSALTKSVIDFVSTGEVKAQS